MSKIRRWVILAPSQEGGTNIQVVTATAGQDSYAVVSGFNALQIESGEIQNILGMECKVMPANEYYAFLRSEGQHSYIRQIKAMFKVKGQGPWLG